MNNELLETTDLQQVASLGAARYQEIKDQYEPADNGKFLAIDIGSGDAYLAESSAEAVVKARTDHPETVFYVVKVGYDAAETMAQLLHSAK